MENGGVLKDKRYCSRGLEPYTKRGVMNKKEERKNSIDAVLYEQKRQRRQGILDEEAIANRYKSKTADYQLRALIFGSRDLREAKTLSW